MPLYEYECQACGARSEVIQRFSDDPLTTCETCGGELKKLLSAPSFQLKGSGWYKTDYASSSGKKKANDSKSVGDSKDTSSSGDTSTKPPAKESQEKKATTTS